MKNPDFFLDNYNYELPSESIAQEPAQPVESAKLLIGYQSKSDIENFYFYDLPKFLTDSDVLVCNNTKVFRARIPLQQTKIKRRSGEIREVDGEIFVYQLLSDEKLECLVSDDKNFKPGAEVFLDENNNISLISESYAQDGIVFSVKGISVYDFLEKYGQMPLPPYIKYEKEKEKWYQTTFAETLGSAAAPTASLHFSQSLLNDIKNKGTEVYFSTLHVGLGTFKPVYEPDIRNQKLHLEPVIIEKTLFQKIYDWKKSNKNLIAVGTTMVRLLETLPYLRSAFSEEEKDDLGLDDKIIQYRNRITGDIHVQDVENFIHNIDILKDRVVCETRLFIFPGWDFRIIDEMITNFHLPKSSLLMLVSALLGREKTLNIYEDAKKNGYKFYSFGDGMWIKK